MNCKEKTSDLRDYLSDFFLNTQVGVTTKTYVTKTKEKIEVFNFKNDPTDHHGYSSFKKSGYRNVTIRFFKKSTLIIKFILIQ